MDELKWASKIMAKLYSFKAVNRFVYLVKCILEMNMMCVDKLKYVINIKYKYYYCTDNIFLYSDA